MIKHYTIAIIAGAAILGSIAAAGAQERAPNLGAARAAAINECSILASRYPETTFAALEIELYRACMARHGEAE